MLGSISVRKFRNEADDIDQADPDYVSDIVRKEIMEEKGDKWLLTLIEGERE